jgi:hypothetical protein
MGLRLPLKARIAVCWVLILIGPFFMAFEVWLATQQEVSWPFYLEALVYVGAWSYIIVLLRRFRREQRELDSAQ